MDAILIFVELTNFNRKNYGLIYLDIINEIEEYFDVITISPMKSQFYL